MRGNIVKQWQEPTGFAVPETVRVICVEFCKWCCVREKSYRRSRRFEVGWKGECLQWITMTIRNCQHRLHSLQFNLHWRICHTWKSIKVSLIEVKQKWIRNRLKCHLFQSRILSLSLITVHDIDITFTYCSNWNPDNGQTLTSER